MQLRCQHNGLITLVHKNSQNTQELLCHRKEKKNNEYHLCRQENRKASESKKKHQKKSEERINHADRSNLLLYGSLYNFTAGKVSDAE